MNNILYAVIISLVIGFFSGWKVNTWKYNSEREIEAKTFTEAMESAAKELAKIEVKNVTIKQQLETKIVERPVYRECKHDDDVMRLINSTLTGQFDNSELPTTSSAK